MSSAGGAYPNVPVAPGGGQAKVSLRNLRTFSSFKNPVFRIYFFSMLGQMAAMNMQMMTGTLLIYRITGSAAILGLMALATALPTLFLSLFGGVIADRVQKKYVIQVGQVASLIVSLGVALSLTLGYLSAERAGSWWILLVSSLLQGATMGLMMPSRQAILREIVAKEELMNATSLNIMGMNIFRILAPAVAGFLIDAFDFQAVYYTMTGMYLSAVVLMAFLPRTSSQSIRGGTALADIKEGFRYVRRETTILLILLFALFGTVLSMPYGLLLPVFTEDIFKVGAGGMGILMSISGIGAIIGSLILASLPNKKRGLIMLVSSLFLGIVLVVFSFSTSWSLALVLMVFLGLGQAGQMTLGGTLLQYYTEPAYLGRVMSILMMQFGLTSFSTFAAGLLAEGIGVQWSIGGFAIILILLVILTLLFVPRLRRLD